MNEDEPSIDEGADAGRASHDRQQGMSRPLTWGERLALWHRRRHPYGLDELRGSGAAEAAKAYAADRVMRTRERADSFSDGRYPALEAELRGLADRFETEGDVVPELFARIRDDVIRKVDRSRCLRDPTRLLVQSTDDASVNAVYRPFPDGTGLIQVCEGLSGLIDLLSKQMVLSAGVTAGALPLLTDDAFTRAATTPCRDDLYSFAVDVSLLRWTLLHQRFYGTGSSVHRRLPARIQRAVDSINLRAVRFVVAHECAHHHLGHPGVDTAGADDIALENAADDAALDDLDLAGDFGTTDALGALIATLALECFDAISAVRPAHTHPSPRARTERILERMEPARRATAEELLDRVRRVVDRAADLADFVDAAWWKTMIEHPDVLLEPRTEVDVQKVFEIDRVATGPLANSDRVLDHLGATTGVGLVDVAERIRTGSWPEGLTALTIPTKKQCQITDHGQPLSFSLLLRESGKGLARLGVEDPTSHLVAAMTFARLIEHRILEETTRDRR